MHRYAGDSLQVLSAGNHDEAYDAGIRREAANQTGRESDWRSGNAFAGASPEDIERHNADKWAPNIRDHGPYRLVHQSPTYGSGQVTAHVQDSRGWKGVGYLSYTRRHDLEGTPTEIHKVQVHPDHQRRGLASAMLDLARESHPEMQHSHALSDDGRAWAEKKAVQAPPPGLSFTHDEFETGGSKFPTRIHLRAHTPEDGQVGALIYYPPKRRNGIVQVHNLHVEPDHRRRGIGSALMDEMQRRHPDSTIDHGDRTWDGEDWWKGYTDGKTVRRGRTASEEYWMGHRPGGPSDEEEQTAAPAHALDRVYPKDVYDRPDLYGGGDGLYGGRKAFAETVRTLRQARGNPEHPVTMYRALPPEHAHEGFRTGDWTSVHPDYARGHGLHATDEKEDLPVIKATVPAKHLWNNGDSLDEFGYHGPPIKGEIHFPGGVNAQKRLRKTGATQMVRPSEIWDHIRTDVHPHRLDTIRDSVAQHGWQPDWNVADGPIKVSLDPPVVSNGSHRLHVLRELGRDEPIPMQVTAATSELPKVLYKGLLQHRLEGVREKNGFIPGDMGESGPGVYLSASKEYARRFAGGGGDRGGAVLHVEHDVQNPLVRRFTREGYGNAVGDEGDREYRAIQDEARGHEIDNKLPYMSSFREHLAKHGYDAVVTHFHNGTHEVAVHDPSKLRITHISRTDNDGNIVSTEPWDGGKTASLSDEDRVSVAEQVMDRAGLNGRSIDVPRASFANSPEGVHPSEHQRTLSREAEDYVHHALTGAGWKPPVEGHRIRVEPSHWSLREPGSGQAVTDGASYIGLAGNHTSERDLLHEAAHVLTRTTEDSDAHGRQFQQTVHGLYRKHLGPEAAETFRNLVEPQRREAVTENWPPHLTEREDKYGDTYPVNVSRSNPRGPVATESEAQAAGLVGPYYHGTSKRRAREIRSGGFRQPRLHNWEMGDAGTAEEVDMGNTHRTYFADTHDEAMHFAQAHHGQDADVVTAYLHPDHMEHDKGGGWMPSVTVKDVTHATAIRPERKQATRTTPHDRVFGPTYGLDIRLWENDKLREPIRADIIARWRTFCLRHNYRDWSTWVKIVFFGSEASEWTGPGQIGNGDFDLSIGIEYERMRAANPSFEAMADAEIAQQLTAEMFTELRVDDEWFAVESATWLHASSSMSHGQLSNTSPVDQPPISQSRQGSVSRPSAGHWRSLESSDATTGRRSDLSERPAATAGRSWSEQSTPSSLPLTALFARGASGPIFEPGIFAIGTGSRSSSTSPSSSSRAGDAPFASGTTSSSSSIMTTSAVLGSGAVASASEESSVPDAIKRSGISESNILEQHSVTWPGGPPPIPLPDGWTWIGPFSHTWFANVLGWNIAVMRPYAAYDVIAQEWIVRPPHLPDWDLGKMPAPVRTILRAAETTARNTLKLPEPERTLQGARLYEMWHADRSNAFGPQGEGWYDLGNLREKWLDQLDLWAPLYQAHKRAENLQLADWSNTPHFGSVDKKFTDALDEVGRKEHPNVEHYQSGGRGHLPGDESKSVVGFLPVHMVKQMREHAGDWNGEPSRNSVEGVRSDIRKGVGIRTPLMIEYNHDLGWGYLGEGNHRLRAADEEGLHTVPVRVVRSYGGVERRKEKGIGGPMKMQNPDKDVWGDDYVPSDIHPYHFLTEHKQAGLYHWAPKDARDSIAEHGLDHRLGPGGHEPQGIFFHHDLGRARDWVPGIEQTHDLYEVDDRGLRIHPDPYDTGDASYTAQPVPPERIHRLGARRDPHHGEGPWFHGTNADLKPGDQLLPGDQVGEKSHGHFSDGTKVWVSNDPWRASAYGQRTFAVEPHSRPRSPYANHDEHHTLGATVLHEVDRQGRPVQKTARDESNAQEPPEETLGPVREASPEEFEHHFNKALEGNPYSYHLTHHNHTTINEGHMKPLLAHEGRVGVLVHDHGDGRVEATGLFNRSGIKSAGSAMLQHAIQHHGVNYVEAFGPHLPKVYERLGFQTHERYPFDRSLAHPNWDYHRFGEPDYHTMHLNGRKEAAMATSFATVNWDDPQAVAALREEIEAELLAENGQEWFDTHRHQLDENWLAALHQLGVL